MMSQTSSPRSISPRQRSSRKHVLSPKKAKKKRVPKCDGCGKRDGEDAGVGAPQGARVKLKICARCRGVAYCSAACQKLRWPTHRLRCVRADPPTVRAPPSPAESTRSGRQHKILTSSTGTAARGGPRRQPSAQLGVTPTPRNRENAPTRHPFFGPQHEAPSRSRNASPTAPYGRSPAPWSSRRRVSPSPPPPEQQLQRNQRLGSQEGLASPPPFERLNSARSWQSSTGGSAAAENSLGNNLGKIIRLPSGNRLRSTRGQHSTEWDRPASPSPPLGRTPGPFSRENRTGSGRILRIPASTRERMVGTGWFSSLPSSKDRSNTCGPGVFPTDNRSPPPARETPVGDSGLSDRRMSAPAYAAAAENKHRIRVKGFATATGGLGKRGPPPPYALVAHRAQSVGGGRSPHDDYLSAVKRASSVDGLGGARAQGAPVPIPPPSISPITAELVSAAIGKSPSNDSISPSAEVVSVTSEGVPRNRIGPSTTEVIASGCAPQNDLASAQGSQSPMNEGSIRDPVECEPENVQQGGEVVSQGAGEQSSLQQAQEHDIGVEGREKSSASAEAMSDPSATATATATVTTVTTAETAATGKNAPISLPISVGGQDFTLGTADDRADAAAMPRPSDTHRNAEVSSDVDVDTEDQQWRDSKVEGILGSDLGAQSGSAMVVMEAAAAAAGTPLALSSPSVSTCAQDRPPPTADHCAHDTGIPNSNNSQQDDEVSVNVNAQDVVVEQQDRETLSEKGEGSDDILLALTGSAVVAEAAQTATTGSISTDSQDLRPLSTEGGPEETGEPESHSPVAAGELKEENSVEPAAGIEQHGGVGAGAQEAVPPSPSLDIKEARVEEVRAGLTVTAPPPSGDGVDNDEVLAGPSPTEEESSNGLLELLSRPALKGPTSPQTRHSLPVAPPRASSPSVLPGEFVNGLSRSSMSSPQGLAINGSSPRALRRLSPRPRPPGSPGPALSPTSLPPNQRPSVLPEVPLEETDTVSSPDSSHRDEVVTPLNDAEKSPTTAQKGKAGQEDGEQAEPSNDVSTFVPVVDFSPKMKPPSPNCPGPRRTETATYYQRRFGKNRRGSSLPPASATYIGRPAGFSVHVLVASAPTAVDLAAPTNSPVRHGSTTVPASLTLKTARAERALRKVSEDGESWLFYSFEERERLGNALRAGDVILLTPGRYEARAWGLQHLLSSVEIIGAGSAKTCVLYNIMSPTPGQQPDPCLNISQAEHYLIGIMGDAGAPSTAAANTGDRGGGEGDDDSDSGWEDGAFGPAEVAVETSDSAVSGAVRGRGKCRRAVRVRLANLTLEQGSGYRGAVYQLGRESHLELDGCLVRCSQGGVNVDQGTCFICDCVVKGSEGFGVHIGGEGAVEHCSIRNCGTGGGSHRRARAVSSSSSLCSASGKGFGSVFDSVETTGHDGDDCDDADDGTNVNRAQGMPAISFLQSSRMRARFNVIVNNAGHAVQCRDSPLPGGDDKRAMLVRRAEVEAEEQLTAWLGRASILLRDHLADQRRHGSVVTEGNMCQHNTACETSGCCNLDNTGGIQVRRNTSSLDSTSGMGATAGGGSLGAFLAAESGKAALPSAQLQDRKRSSDGIRDGGSKRWSDTWNSSDDGPICQPTGEQEGLPLPAMVTLRFLSAMDAGYVGSRREENARLRKQRFQRSE